MPNGERLREQPPWGGDFFLEAMQKYNPDIEIEPAYRLRCPDDVDVLWLHNVATCGYRRIIGPVKDRPLRRYFRRRNRPAIIGGVRGEVGFNHSFNQLPYLDAVHTSNEALARKSRMWNRRVFVLSAGVDVDQFKPGGEAPDRFIIGWAGDPKKRMKNFKLICRLGLPYYLATKDIYWPHGDMPLFYNSLSAYTHFSSHEGSNRTILEAAACGVPIVCTDVGSAGLLVGDEWRIPYTDDHAALVEEFKRRLGRLEADPGLCARVGEENRVRAQAFSWGAVAERWRGIVHSVVDGRD